MGMITCAVYRLFFVSRIRFWINMIKTKALKEVISWLKNKLTPIPPADPRHSGGGAGRFCSSLLAGDIAGKYAMLNKAPLSPPGSVFGPVWIVLYLLMGIAIFLVLRTNTDDQLKRSALGLFVIQLLLNFLWSILFFGGSSFWLAAIIILLLDAAVIAASSGLEKSPIWPRASWFPTSSGFCSPPIWTSPLQWSTEAAAF